MTAGPFDAAPAFSCPAETAAADQWAALTDAADEARRRVLAAALRILSGEPEEREHAHSADEVQYAQELLALAARDLTRATDALPVSQQPVNWRVDTP